MKKKFRKNKLLVLGFIFILFIGLFVGIPSLAKLKNRNTIYSVDEWDGSVASSYKKGDGSEADPYIISNGSEYAFFIEQLKTTDYSGIYFELSNDIVINNGIFEYTEEAGLQYIVNGNTYYVEEYSDKYYDNSLKEGNHIGQLKLTSTIKNFKGNLNGNSFTIYGTYITSAESTTVSLFENLEGKISDLYITNSVVYGKGDVAGFAINSYNSTFKNLLYDGYVINKSGSKTIDESMETVSFVSNILEENNSILLPKISLDGLVKNIKLIGQYTTSNEEVETIIKLNSGEILNSDFVIQLGTDLPTEIPLIISSQVDGVNVTFENLKYVVEYYDDVTSGLISNSTNSSLTNVINKSNVHGNYISSGFIGKVNENFKINNSYNEGNVVSNYISGGIIGVLKNNTNSIEIVNVYNKGNISSMNSGDFIGYVIDNSGNINISNSINTSSNCVINTINNSIVNISNSYSINGNTVCNGQTVGSFAQTNLQNLSNSEFMTKISYTPFIGLEDVKTNEANAWVYEKESLPILYIDDLNNPIANLNIGIYNWNNLSTELNLLNISNNITFKIENISSINPVKEKYYYVKKSSGALSNLELETVEWTKYENEITIEESGYYVIYAKIIDSENKITYINSDVMVLNISGFQTIINMEGYSWGKFKTNLNEIYTNKDINITITAHNDLVEMNSVEYFVSKKELTEEEVKNIIDWTAYSNYITLNTPGKYVIYAKIVDANLTTTYINTDYINYSGFKETLSLGNNNVMYNTNYISNNSSIKLIFEKENEITYKDGFTYNLISNILLPLGTEITLIDKNTNKIYKNIIETEEDIYGYSSSCSGLSNCSNYATYSFDMFKEMGVLGPVYYDDTNNYNKQISNEKYIIIIDFKNTTVIENYYGVSFNLLIKSQDGETIYNTLNNTIEGVNIYSLLNDSQVVTVHSINSDYNNETINYNSNSEININFTNDLIYSSINDKNIIDTSYENKKSGLEIKITDAYGAKINKKYLDNIIFEVNGIEYFASNDNSIKINLGSVTSKEIKTLKIKTKENSSDLKIGTYYIKINGYISEDGYYYNDLYDEQVIIPLIVDNNIIEVKDYNFDIQMDSQSIILDNDIENNLITFNIIYSGLLTQPNIRISLYKKDKLTAYNQDYTLIDLKEYVSNELIRVEEKKYIVDKEALTFDLDLLTNKFENTGYKYVFELYDGPTKVSQIDKYFIVK